MADLGYVSDERIRECLYVKNDGRLAAYLGVSAHRVARVRAASPPRRPLHSGGGVKADYGANSNVAADQAARDGSTLLLRALLRYGAKHDGLPGMPAESFIARCDEMDIAVVPA